MATGKYSSHHRRTPDLRDLLFLAPCPPSNGVRMRPFLEGSSALKLYTGTVSRHRTEQRLALAKRTHEAA